MNSATSRGAKHANQAIRHPGNQATASPPVKRAIVWAATVGFGMVGAGLAFAYLWPQDWLAQERWYLAGCGVAFGVRLVQFHLGVLCLIAAAGLALLRNRTTIPASRAAPRPGSPRFAAALGLIVGLSAAGPALWAAIPFPTPQATGGATLRVLSLNLDGTNRDVDAIVRALEEADADVLLLQEIVRPHHRAIREALGERYPYWHVKMLDAGVACASSRPIIVAPADQSGHLGETVGLSGEASQALHPGHWLRVEVELRTPRAGASPPPVPQAGRRIALYSLHLQKPDSWENLYASRAQLAAVMRMVERDPLPIVLAGDFNFGPWTPNAAALRSIDLHGAHADAGSGLAATRRLDDLPGLGHVPGARMFLKWAPGVRIDHIYLSDELTCTSFGAVGDTGSDHRGLIAQIALE